MFRLFTRFSAAVAIFMAAAVACSEKDEMDYTVDSEITINKTELEFDADQESAKAYVRVSSTYKWKAETTVDWIQLSIREGEAGQEYKMIVSADQNRDFEVREGMVNIISGKWIKQIKVTQGKAAKVLKPEEVPNYDKIHIPEIYSSYGYLRSDKPWYFGRSKQSEHFIIFWAKEYEEYGDILPSDKSQGRYRVDIDALLAWAEKCFEYYTETLKFVDHGKGKSYTDKYKMIIQLNRSTTWKAEGFGVDDVIGLLTVSPDAANDYPTLAHEIGHIFQYQVYCDQLLNGEVKNDSRSGWRYSQGPKGSGIWEQTAQWQAHMMCPEATYQNYYFGVYCDNCNRHFLHEDMRYGSYFFHYYWIEKYGIDAVGKIWRGARAPEDACQAYMSVYDLSLEEFNSHVYDFASRVATWDLIGIRDEGLKYLNRIPWKSTKSDDGYYKVKSESCLEATGFNIIKLKDWTPGNEVSVDFVGLPNDASYNSSGDESVAGWTMGFVSLSDDGKTRTYSPSTTATAATDNTASMSWTVPADCSNLWAVVACTPTEYISHGWDENNTNDRHWGYKVKFTGANP